MAPAFFLYRVSIAVLYSRRRSKLSFYFRKAAIPLSPKGGSYLAELFRMPVSGKEIDLLLVHLLRDDKTIQEALDKLEPGDFNRPTERPHAIMWAISRDYYREHHSPIPCNWLITRISRVIEDDPSIAEWIDRIEFLVREAYDSDGQINSQASIMTLLQPLLDERKVHCLVESFATRLDPLDVTEMLSQISNAAANSRVLLEDDIDICDLDDPRHWGQSVNPKPTGSPVFDALLGGYKPSHLAGVLAISGGGKSSLGMEVAAAVAKQQLHAYFFSWELPVHHPPLLRNRLYACVSGVDTDEISAEPMSAGVFQTVREKMREVQGFMHTIDMTRSDAGGNGVEDAAAILHRHVRDGREPTVVILDWMGAIAEKYMAAHGMEPDARYDAMSRIVSQARDLATRFNTQVILPHQYSASSASRGVSWVPTQYDAMGFRSFGNYMDAVLVMTKPDPAGVMRIITDKVRGTRQSHMAKLHGQTGRFTLLTSGDWQVTRSANGDMFWIETGNSI